MPAAELLCPYPASVAMLPSHLAPLAPRTSSPSPGLLRGPEGGVLQRGPVEYKVLCWARRPLNAGRPSLPT
eukprot:6385628-Pyramimonas_sp.AAC.1